MGIDIFLEKCYLRESVFGMLFNKEGFLTLGKKKGNIMNEEQVVALMKGSKSEQEWNENCDRVKGAFGGNYPSFWFSAIVLSGVASQIAATFGGSADIKVIPIA